MVETLKNLLSSVLNLREGESHALGLLQLHGFAKGVCFVYFETAANSYFIDSYGTALLPYIYMCVALVSTALGLAISRAEGWMTPTRFLATLATFLLLSITLFYALMVGMGSKWPAFMLMIWKDVVFIILELEFWALAGYLFNVRQGKRLFGLAGTGAIVAGIIAGLMAPLTVHMAGQAALLLVSAISALVLLITAIQIMRVFAERFLFDSAPPEKSGYSLKELARKPYILWLSAFSILSYFCFYLVDYTFYAQVDQHYSSAEDLAVFFGYFYATLNAGLLITSSFVAGRLLLRFGLPIGLMVAPVIELAGSAAGVTSVVLQISGFLFIIVVLLKIGDEIVRPAFEGTAYRVLYQALPVSTRLRVQTIRETMVEPMAVGLAGLLLLLGNELLNMSGDAMLRWLLVLLPIWIIVALKLRRSYTSTLARSLGHRVLHRDELNLNDASTIKILKSGLGGESSAALYSLTLLDNLEREHLPRCLKIALVHKDPQVRRKALSSIGFHKVADLTEQVETIAQQDSAPKVRGKALQALTKLNPDTALRLLKRYQGDEALEVRHGALVGLLHLKDDHAEGALKQLSAELESKQPRRRRFVAEVIGDSAAAGGEPLLAKLLQDTDQEVRKAAIVAAGSLCAPSLLPPLIQCLADAELANAASEALTLYGETAVCAFEGILCSYCGKAVSENGDGCCSRSVVQLPEKRRDLVVIRIMRICRLIGGKAPELLYHCLDSESLEARRAAIKALAASGHRADEKGRTLIERQITLEVEAIAWGMASQRDLRGEDRYAPIRAALEVNIARRRSNLFLLLAPLYGSDRVMSAHDRYLSSSADQRASSLELLDNLMAPEIKRLVLPALDDSDRITALRTLSAFVPQQIFEPRQRLQILVSGLLPASLWTRACALNTLGEEASIQVVAGALADPLDIIRETALGCVRTRPPHGALERLVSLLQEDPQPQIRKLAKNILQPPQEEKHKMFLTVEKVMILKSSELFSQVPEEYLIHLASMLEEMLVPPGREVIHYGDHGNEMFIVVRGSLRVHIGDRLLGTVGAGDVFGEMAVLDPERRAASVTTMEECQLFKIAGRDILELMENHPLVASGFVRVLIQRIRKRDRERLEKEKQHEQEEKKAKEAADR